jgi:hypothetical protein
MNHLHRNLLQHCDRGPLRMSVARYCDLSLCDDHVAALRNRVLDALNALDVKCALAYRMNELACRMSELACRMNELALNTRASLLACRMNELDARCAPDAKNALAYRMNELAYQMCALREVHHRHDVGDLMYVELGDMMCDALDARCALLQTLLRETLAYRPY